MATATIPQLTQAIALTGDEQMEAVQAGTSVRVTTAQVAALNVTPGPAGPQGPAGIAGPAGAKGPTGPVYGPTTAPKVGALAAGTVLGQLAVTADGNQWSWNYSQWIPTIASQEWQTLFQQGFLGDGVTDDSAAINATIALGGHVTFPPRRHVKINSGLVIKSGFATVDFNGCWVDASGMTAGYALSLVNDTTPTVFANTSGLYGLYTAANPISNLLLTGPNSTANITDGLFMGVLAGSGQVSGQTVQNVQIWGFRIGCSIGNSAYIIPFYNVNISTCWLCGFQYIPPSSNAGECFNWHGGRISNCVNAGTAIGFFMQISGGGHNEIALHSVTVDYNDNGIVNYGGILTIIGGHNEDASPNPMISIVGQASSQATGVYIEGGTMAPTNTTPTQRPTYVSIDGTLNPKTFFNAQCRWNTYGNAATLITVVGGTPQVSLAGSIVDFNALIPASFPTIAPTALNRIANPGFEGSATGAGIGTFTGWTQTPGAGQTFSIVTSVVHSGTYAAQLVATGVTNGSISQVTAVTPGQQYNLRIWINITACTSGGVFPTVHFYSFDGTLLLAINQTVEYTATTGGWVPALLSGTIPNQVSQASLQVYLYGFTGTVYVDDAEFYCY